jgi:hypothetical protein
MSTIETQKKTYFELQIALHHREAQLMNFARDVYKLLSTPACKRARNTTNFTDYVRVMDQAERYRENFQIDSDGDFSREDDWEIRIVNFTETHKQFTVKQLREGIQASVDYAHFIEPSVLHQILDSLVKRNVLVRPRWGVLQRVDA